jgi:myo-inositol-hexaphosphate 3-phosphohydrolase
MNEDRNREVRLRRLAKKLDLRFTKYSAHPFNGNCYQLVDSYNKAVWLDDNLDGIEFYLKKLNEKRT